MTSFRQIEANRRNARKSTGPTTEDGKQRSRCNAVRRGLMAGRMIGAAVGCRRLTPAVANLDHARRVEREGSFGSQASNLSIWHTVAAELPRPL